ncbi:hypothetical protein DL766_007666 [Monosporascus sp. MC13-8B]|uniref:Protein BIG1 n=1 Tax=Monosporascus cannonballus TaxID=155416 RepID=A0ABY0HB61_9PEZI|nr:hypothetical protein DL762_004256 [Monosporascus cannonballus]RYP22742.1 hypothetical protein DL766_007666 [Monosporascus sp. MC13-8B]
MRLSTTGALAAFCATAHAFSDSSPFILFSTAKLPKPASLDQLQSSSQVMESAKHLLKSCPTTRYLVVSQPNLNAAHLAAGQAVPNLYQRLEKAESRLSIAEVIGDLDVKELSDYIRESCDGKSATVDVFELGPIATTQSATALKENGISCSIIFRQTANVDCGADDQLAAVLEQYQVEGSYTVIYAAGPRTEAPKTYTADFQDSTHVELKRQLQHLGKRALNDTSNLPLFEKYQFFTPGIFMAVFALVVLLSILYSGISALSSLEVSYGAFDKEMGPAAQKKQQ